MPSVVGALKAAGLAKSAYDAAKKTPGVLKGVAKKTKKAIKVGQKAGKAAVHGAKIAGAGVHLAARLANPINKAKMIHTALKGEGLVLPGSKYIGPGNRMDKGKPKDKADANAYQHDLDYDAYLKKGHSKKHVYTGYSDADERLLKNTPATTASGLAVNLGMGAKKLLNKTGLTKRIRDTDVIPKK
jgi:hypothetical protein